jgi:hypothetical protein
MKTYTMIRTYTTTESIEVKALTMEEACDLAMDDINVVVLSIIDDGFEIDYTTIKEKL